MSSHFRKATYNEYWEGIFRFSILMVTGVAFILFGNFDLLLLSLGTEGAVLLFMVLGFFCLTYTGALLSVFVNKNLNLRGYVRKFVYVLYAICYVALWFWSLEQTIVIKALDISIGTILLGVSLVSISKLRSRGHEPKIPSEPVSLSTYDTKDEKSSKEGTKNLVLLEIIWIAYSTLAASAIVTGIGHFALLPVGLAIYVLESCLLGAFFLPKVFDFLFLGFVVFGGLSFGPFVLGLTILSLMGISPGYSIFFAILFPSALSLYWLGDKRITKPHRGFSIAYPEAFTVFIFILAFWQTLGLVSILTAGFTGLSFFESLVSNISYSQFVVLSILTSLLMILVFSIGYAFFCLDMDVFKSDLSFQSKAIREAVAFFPMSTIILGGYLIPILLYGFATHHDFPLVGIFETAGFVFSVSVFVIGAGFYQMIIATTALGFKSKKENLSKYVFKNLMFFALCFFTFGLSTFGGRGDMWVLLIIRSVFVGLILYEFFDQISQTTILYDLLSQRLRIPGELLKFVQIVTIMFIPFVIEIADAYMYAVLLPFWAIGVVASSSRIKSPRILKLFVQNSEFTDQGKRIPSTLALLRPENRKDLTKQHRLANRIYAGILTGVVTGLLQLTNLAITRPANIFLFFFWYAMILPLYASFKWILDRRLNA